MCIEYKDKYECVDYRTYIMGIAEYPCPCDKCCFNTNKKQTMGKAEKFIQDCTRNCSNELCAVEDRFGKKVISYHEWLSPDQARRAVEIAKEETTEKIKQLLKENYLIKSIEPLRFVSWEKVFGNLKQAMQNE